MKTVANIFVALSMALIILACGGGGGSSDGKPFSIQSTYPSDGAKNVVIR